jgi:hypothetical protein
VKKKVLKKNKKINKLIKLKKVLKKRKKYSLSLNYYGMHCNKELKKLSPNK